VELALAQGKKVFVVVPKSPRAKRGFELFVKKGAVALRSVDNVLEYLTSVGSVVEQRMEAFYPNPQEKLGTSDSKREDSL
jgi:predicted Rossmann fold nucleotide-binding protein DprA/Smf involved in DNA uptake